MTRQINETPIIMNEQTNWDSTDSLCFLRWKTQPRIVLCIYILYTLVKPMFGIIFDSTINIYDGIIMNEQTNWDPTDSLWILRWKTQPRIVSSIYILNILVKLKFGITFDSTIHIYNGYIFFFSILFLKKKLFHESSRHHNSYFF